MILFVFALLAGSVAAAPTPLTAGHQRDIACVAFFGVVASKQRAAITGYGPLPDMKTDGPRWAGIVGERVMRETGQPKELVGFAIQEAVPGAQSVFERNNPYPGIERRLAECEPIMRADLAAVNAVNVPLPKPVKAPQK